MKYVTAYRALQDPADLPESRPTSWLQALSLPGTSRHKSILHLSAAGHLSVRYVGFLRSGWDGRDRTEIDSSAGLPSTRNVIPMSDAGEYTGSPSARHAAL